MSPKARPSKDKRVTQNRARREALAARTAAAKARDERAAARSTSQPARKKGLLGRVLAPPPGDRARPVRGAPQGSVRGADGRVPGQKAVILAFMFTVVSAVFLAFVPITVEREVDERADVPEGCEIVEETTTTTERDGGEDGSAAADEPIRCEERVTIPGEAGAAAVLVLGLPLAISGYALYALKKERQARLWTIALVAFAVYLFLLAGSFGIAFLPALVALTVASFQARKAEQTLLLAEARTTAADSHADEDVIEAEVVDEMGEDDGDEFEDAPFEDELPEGHGELDDDAVTDTDVVDGEDGDGEAR